MNQSLDSIHFIISAPRSGSTWLAKALGQHPEIVATENRLFGSFCEIWQNQNGTSSPRITFDRYAEVFSRHTFYDGLGLADAQQFQQEFMPAYFAFLIEFLRNRSGKSIVVDKITPYLQTSNGVVEQINKWFPKAKIIQLIRDGRDVVTSGVFDWISREGPESPRFKRFVAKEPDLILKRFFDDESLQRWCEYWWEPIVALESKSDELLTIRYEDMIGDQAAQLIRIFEWLGVEADPGLASQCAEAVSFRQTTGRDSGQEKPLAKARKGVVGDWQNYFTQADARRFCQCTGTTLLKLGYEPDHSWTDRCPEQLALCAK